MKMTTAIATTRPLSASPHRGAFIVLEGVDRCGKTTQVGLLLKHLVVQLGMAAVAMRFPDRTTLVGNLINQYLQSKSELDDRAIHLLFSANRWEVAPTLKSNLLEGKQHVVCDRYAYSGVAFSSAKESLQNDLEWCKSCDVGLPAPDAVIFLDLTQEQAEQRGGYGEERYEKKELQQRVRERFSQLQATDTENGQVPWYVVNAAQSIEEVQQEISAIVEQTIEKVILEEKPLGLLWLSKDEENKEN
ncbi:thymidylate kinase [Nitzschia inconspicua]|uniref:Thymidylate kinase n=1 Tax=Nitzschia inconspicua TaxID=303405 RepID=A0A9K3Q538_9STRA|nr:thymidylate kinase [Nitzschia inconspicua]KAG7368699.1 thymidylate kinase [Nitzschia inconspicua]